MNNFDQSSTGTNIETSVFYDSCRAQYEWRENFKTLESNRRGSSVCYYVDNGNVEGPDSISFEIAGTVKELKTACEKLAIKHELPDTYRPKKLDYQETILNHVQYYDSITLINYEDLSEQYGVKIVPSKELVKVSIRGYSQGDYAEVIYCPSDLEAAWGKAPEESEMIESFEHYFYDQPIYACVTINGTEFFYHDSPDYNEYDWQPEKFAAYVSKESGTPESDILALLPETPDYN